MISILLMAQVLSPQQALDRALQASEPAPALRAAFRATLSTDKGSRRVEFDPYAEAGKQFVVAMSSGRDEELDAVVADWASERQADARIFADDLRASLGEARVTAKSTGWGLEFRRKILPKDGPVDRAITSVMKGELSLDPQGEHLSRVTYRIEKPIRLEDGTTLTDFMQTYDFGFSWRWGVSYVSSYELLARGGRWGFSERRGVKVQLTDVSFTLAGDARQQLASKSAPVTGRLAGLR